MLEFIGKYIVESGKLLFMKIKKESVLDYLKMKLKLQRLMIKEY